MVLALARGRVFGFAAAGAFTALQEFEMSYLQGAFELEVASPCLARFKELFSATSRFCKSMKTLMTFFLNCLGL